MQFLQKAYQLLALCAEEASSAQAKAKEARKREKKRSKAFTKAIAAGASTPSADTEGVDSGTEDATPAVSEAEQNTVATDSNETADESEREILLESMCGKCVEEMSESARQQGSENVGVWDELRQHANHRKDGGQRRGLQMGWSSRQRGNVGGGGANVGGSGANVASRRSMDVARCMHASGAQARSVSDITNQSTRLRGSVPGKGDGAAGRSSFTSHAMHGRHAWKCDGDDRDDEQAPWVPQELEDESWPTVGTRQAAGKARRAAAMHAPLSSAIHAHQTSSPDAPWAKTASAVERLSKRGPSDSVSSHAAWQLSRPNEISAGIETTKAGDGGMFRAEGPDTAAQAAAELLGSWQGGVGSGLQLQGSTCGPRQRSLVGCEETGSRPGPVHQGERDNPGELFGRQWDEDMQHLREELCRGKQDGGEVASGGAGVLEPWPFEKVSPFSAPLAQLPDRHLKPDGSDSGKADEGVHGAEWHACINAPRGVADGPGPVSIMSRGINGVQQGAGWQGWQPLGWEGDDAGGLMSTYLHAWFPGILADETAVLEDETAVTEPSGGLPRPDLDCILRHALDEEPDLQVVGADNATGGSPQTTGALSASWNPLAGGNVVCGDSFGQESASGLLGSVLLESGARAGEGRGGGHIGNVLCRGADSKSTETQRSSRTGSGGLGSSWGLFPGGEGNKRGIWAISLARAGGAAAVDTEEEMPEWALPSMGMPLEGTLVDGRFLLH